MDKARGAKRRCINGVCSKLAGNAVSSTNWDHHGSRQEVDHQQHFGDIEIPQSTALLPGLSDPSIVAEYTSLTNVVVNGAQFSVATGTNVAEQSSERIGDENEVCFGMITLSDVLLLNHRSFRRQRHRVVVLPGGKTFGSLDESSNVNIPLAEVEKHTQVQILEELQKHQDIELQCCCLAVCSSSKSRNGQQGNRQLCEVQIIIYGRFKIFEQLGDFVEKCGLYLQDPELCDRNVRYTNPHVLGALDEEPTWTERFWTSPSSIETTDDPVDVFSQFTQSKTLTEAPQPRSLRTQLHKHQRQGLHFLLQRERSWSFSRDCPDVWSLEQHSPSVFLNNVTQERLMVEPKAFRGGIVADQMGLGKTLLMISLIASDYESHVHQIPRAFGDHDDGTEQIQSTLVIVPFALLHPWRQQLRKHLMESSLTWTIFHGPKRTKDVNVLKSFNVVLTTYDVVLSEMRSNSDASRCRSPLFSVSWHRLVLDEAHVIRQMSSSRALAVCALNASRRWAVSGTPIQNRLTDLASLISFLRVYPFDNPSVFNQHILRPWKTGRDTGALRKLKFLVNCITLRRDKDVLCLPHRDNHVCKIDLDPSERQAYDAIRLQTLSFAGQPSAFGGKDFRSNILNRINRLRMSCNGHEVLLGPPDISDIESMSLLSGSGTPLSDQSGQSMEHEDPLDFFAPQLQAVGNANGYPYAFHNIAYQGTTYQDTAFQDTAFQNTIYQDIAYQNIACHTTEYQTTAYQIPACQNTAYNDSTYQHNAYYATSNVSSLPSAWPTQNATLPEPFPSSAAIPTILEEMTYPTPRPTMSPLSPQPPPQLSSKLKAVISQILQTQTLHKTVIFSFWLTTLDILASALTSHSIKFVRYDGKLTSTQRTTSIDLFQSNPSIRVILATISAAGVGLDLTAASQAILIEPQWNPMAEEQALSRIHRMGQTKPVRTIRYVTRDSIEEAIVILQGRKTELMKMALDGKGEEGDVDGLAELIQLLR